MDYGRKYEKKKKPPGYRLSTAEIEFYRRYRAEIDPVRRRAQKL